MSGLPIKGGFLYRTIDSTHTIFYKIDGDMRLQVDGDMRLQGFKNIFLCLLFPLLLCGFLLGVVSPLQAQNSLGSIVVNPNPLRVKKSYFQRSEIHVGDSSELIIELDIDKGHRAYIQQFHLSTQSPPRSHVTDLLVSPQVEFFDKFSKKKKMGTQGQSKIKTSFGIPEDFPLGKNKAVFQLQYQTCTDTYCLLPKNLEFEIPFKAMAPIPNKLLAKMDTTTSSKKESFTQDPSIQGSFGASFDTLLQQLDQQIKEALSRQNWFMLILIAFLGGLATSLLPCIYPMIPITIAILGATQSQQTSRWQALALSLSYVFGIALTYALLGVIAASTGKLFGSLLGNPYVVIAISFLLVLMALSLFGLFEIRIPTFISKRLGGSQALSTKYPHIGAFIAGLTFGLLASPCVGPVLISILTYVAQTQNLKLGFVLLFVFALGFGQLFIVLGLSVQSLKKLPRSGSWMNLIKFTFGIIILLMAAGYVYPLLSSKSQLSSGLEQQAQESIPWQSYSVENLTKAAVEGKAVIIDFYADWCSACKELEEKTFKHSTIQKMGKNFVWIKFDATSLSEDLKRLSQKYSIIGLPHIVFYDTQGNYREELTLNQFENHASFAKRMKKVLEIKP